MENWVGLLDCNNFFVSCERLFRPDLLNVPVVVLSSNDGCVVARSKEIKDMGVPMGVPYFKIKDILKTSNTKVFSGNHKLYKDISKRVFISMAQIVDNMEQYSVDEAFFYFTGTKAEAEKLSTTLRDTVEREVGIPVSIGVAATKTLAKVANDKAKKSRQVVVLTTTDWEDSKQDYLLSDVWGIGGQLSKRFSAAGLVSVADLLQADRARIKQLFGVVGERLQDELKGIPSKQRESKAKQSIMSSRSFKEASSNRAVIEEAVAYHVEQIAYELRTIGYKTNGISVFFAPSRHGDFLLQGQSGFRQLDTPTNSTKVLLQAAIELVLELHVAGVPYKKAGVRVGELVPESVVQESLFNQETILESDVLQSTLDTLSKQFKVGRVHQGFLEGKTLYSAKADARSPGYTTSWNDLAEVKAS